MHITIVVHSLDLVYVFLNSSFTDDNVYIDFDGPIMSPTILKFSSSGNIQQVWGSGMFYMPHSITVDTRGNIWITDVAMHQVGICCNGLTSIFEGCFYVLCKCILQWSQDYF